MEAEAKASAVPTATVITIRVAPSRSARSAQLIFIVGSWAAKFTLTVSQLAFNELISSLGVQAIVLYVAEGNTSALCLTRTGLPHRHEEPELPLHLTLRRPLPDIHALRAQAALDAGAVLLGMGGGAPSAAAAAAAAAAGGAGAGAGTVGGVPAAAALLAAPAPVAAVAAAVVRAAVGSHHYSAAAGDARSAPVRRSNAAADRASTNAFLHSASDAATAAAAVAAAARAAALSATAALIPASDRGVRGLGGRAAHERNDAAIAAAAAAGSQAPPRVLNAKERRDEKRAASRAAGGGGAGLTAAANLQAAHEQQLSAAVNAAHADPAIAAQLARSLASFVARRTLPAAAAAASAAAPVALAVTTGTALRGRRGGCYMEVCAVCGVRAAHDLVGSSGIALAWDPAADFAARVRRGELTLQELYDGVPRPAPLSMHAGPYGPSAPGSAFGAYIALPPRTRPPTATLASLVSLAQANVRLGLLQTAERLYREVLATQRSVHGPEGVDTRETLASLLALALQQESLGQERTRTRAERLRLLQSAERALVAVVGTHTSAPASAAVSSAQGSLTRVRVLLSQSLTLASH